MFLSEFSSLTKRILFFILLSCFTQCVLSLSGLLGLNAVIILPFNCNAIIVWSLEMFVVRQAFVSMLAKKGTVFVRGCIGYHFDGLLIQLLAALHPLVLFIVMWLTSEDAGYDWVIVQELCESRGGRPRLSVLTRLLVFVDVKNYWTVLRHWSQLVPNMSNDIWGH